MRSPAPLLSTSATSRRPLPIAKPVGRSSRVTSEASQASAPFRAAESLTTAPSCGHAQDVHHGIACRFRGGHRDHARERCGHRALPERAAAQAQKRAHRALLVEQRRVRNALSVEVRPDESAHARHARERRLDRKGPVGVVPEHGRRAVLRARRRDPGRRRYRRLPPTRRAVHRSRDRPGSFAAFVTSANPPFASCRKILNPPAPARIRSRRKS